MGRWRVRGAVAGALAAGVWAAAEPFVARRLRTRFTDVRFLGGFLPSGRAWPAAGVAWHLANGAAFGAVFERLGGRGFKQGLVAAQAENALTFPLLPLVARRNPEYRSVRWRRGAEGGRIFLQELAMHALFGALLGALATGAGEPPAPVPAEEAHGKRMPFAFAPRYRGILRALGVTPGRSWVEVEGGWLRVRFGLWRLQTRLDNVRSASVAGPYRHAFKVIGAHLSLADRGVTFGTNVDRGVCVELHEPVKGLDPVGLLRHPNLTVTVADPEALVEALQPRPA